LLVTYLVDGIVSIKIQQWEISIKEDRAVVNRRLGYVLDDISNCLMAKDIKIYKMMNWINENTSKYINESKELEQRVQRKYTNRQLIEVFLVFARNGGAYLYLLWSMLHSNMTIGDFTLYFGAITGFGQWLSQIVSKISGLSNANYRVDDYRYLIETKDHMNREKVAAIPDVKAPCEIRCEDVSFQYEGSNHSILSHINLTIHKGEKLAVVGSNGAGKTTFIKLVCGLLEPTSGRILFNGIDIREYNRDEYYQLISASFQNVCLLPMSIAMNIGYTNDSCIDKEKLYEAVKLAGLNEKITSLPNGLDTELVPSVVEGGINLSGGETQKLMLARAIYKEAPLIILDEPTAALDPIAEQEMYLKYNDLTKNRTAIYISHRLSSTRFCDRIILLDQGTIAESGTHDELMKLSGKYKQLFEIQSQYYKSDAEGVEA
jgi:ABC-type multidrug transport system fused ATPase/permease subunit